MMIESGPPSENDPRRVGPSFFRTALSRFLATVGAGAFVAGAASGQTLPSFTGVGDLPGGTAESVAAGVSADGTTVVGHAIGTAGMEAFRWTAIGGLQGLGFLSMSNPDSEASAVSGDGSVIVGTSDNADGGRAFRWTSGGGMQTLGTFSCSSCDPATGANGVSGNGLVAVGAGLSKSLFGDPALDSARWTGGGTSISGIGDLSGPAQFSVAYGASQTGSIIVGQGDSNAGNQGWWWTSSSGMHALAGIVGAQIRSGAVAISSDGATVVGFANTSATGTGTLEAVRWTGASFATVELLGGLPGAPSPASSALAVNGDGSRIVGRARDSEGSNRAFLWDPVQGMRELSVVLESEYGLDLTGWTLLEARGVSDVDASGVFTVVGDGTNPNGDPEGWVAVLAVPACSDGDDNDGDLDVDFPADTGCTSAVDLSETLDCADGIDNDGDGDADWPLDADCTSASDPTELPDCRDAIDNDGDGLVDHPADPGCATPDQTFENPACDDGVDNDIDLDIDFPADAGCVTAFDLSEVPDCNDGLDNDGDGDFDFPADADCASLDDASEQAECSDGIDNDGDGRIDYPAAYPRCQAADDPIEAAQCGDGVDNDGDALTDFPADPGCASAAAASESPPAVQAGDLLVVDRSARLVFSVDPGTGVQQLVTELAYLTEPQGIATNAAGAPVVADPAGLVEVDSVTGAQRLASGPLVGGESLQVVFPGSGDPYVLEASGISQVQWNPSGLGAKSTWLAVPTQEALPVLGLFAGDSLALEASGDLLTGGFSLFGDGVFRIDDLTGAPSLLKSGFTNDIWLDLAVEDDGTILAVGTNAVAGAGLYRIDPVTGVATAFVTGAPFTTPVAVTRDALGEIYVADAGTCAPACSGGAIIHVDPSSGAPTVVTSGGLIQGEMDLAVAVPVPEPGVLPMVLAGTCLLAVLRRVRAGRSPW